MQKRQDIEKQGNNLIELEKNEHKRRIESINKKFDEKDTKDFEAMQKDNLETLKIGLENEFIEIDKATNKLSEAVQDKRDVIDESGIISDKEKGKLNLQINIEDDNNSIDNAVKKLEALKDALQTVIETNDNLKLAGQKPFIGRDVLLDLSQEIAGVGESLVHYQDSQVSILHQSP